MDCLYTSTLRIYLLHRNLYDDLQKKTTTQIVSSSTEKLSALFRNIVFILYVISFLLLRNMSQYFKIYTLLN